MPDVMLRIEGMHCGSCVKNVARTLAKLDGVEVRRVDIGTALVTIDPARTTSAAVAAAVTDAGYPAQAA
jgi:copper chaperone CopZ